MYHNEFHVYVICIAFCLPVSQVSHDCWSSSFIYLYILCIYIYTYISTFDHICCCNLDPAIAADVSTTASNNLVLICWHCSYHISNSTYLAYASCFAGGILHQQVTFSAFAHIGMRPHVLHHLCLFIPVVQSMLHFRVNIFVEIHIRSIYQHTIICKRLKTQKTYAY